MAMKHLSLLILCLFMLAACVSVPAPVSPGPTLVGDAPANRSCNADAIIVRFLTMPSPNRSYLALAERFNKQNPDVCVQVVPKDSGSNGSLSFSIDQLSLQQTLRQADVLEFPRAYLDATTAPLLVDLKPYIDADATFNLDDVYPQALESIAPAASIYLLPQVVNLPTLSYNKRLWQAQGLPPPDLSWSWRQIINAAQALTRTEAGKTLTYGMLDGGSIWTARYLLVEQGLPVANVAAADVDLQDPRVQAAFRELRQLLDRGVLYSPPANAGNTYFSAAANETVAIWEGSSLDVPELSTRIPRDIGWIAYPPMSSGFAPVTAVNGFVINRATAVPQAAWRWVSFLSHQMPDTTAWLSGFYPARRSIAAQPGPWQQYPTDFRALLARMAEQPFQGADLTPVRDGMLPYARAFQALTDDHATVGEATAAAQRVVDQARSEQRVRTPVPTLAPVPVNTPLPARLSPTARIIRFGAADFDQSRLQGLAAAFNRINGEIVVQIEEQPADLATVAAELDCFSVNGALPQNARSVVVDLQPLVDADATFPRTDFLPTVLDLSQHSGRQEGMPYSLALPVIAYRPELLAAAGIAPPRQDWSLDTMAQTAHRLHQPRGNEPVTGFAAPDLRAAARMFLQAHGATLGRRIGASWEPTFSDPAVMIAVGKLVNLLATTGPPQAIATDPISTTLTIGDGRVALWLDTTRTPPGRWGAQPVAVVAPPFGSGPPDLTGTVATQLVIAARSPYQAECWRWIRYLSDAPDLLTVGVPARMSHGSAPGWGSEMPPGTAAVYAAYVRALQQGRPTVVIPRDADEFVLTWFDRALVHALRGEPLDGTLTAAQQTTITYLTCVNARQDPSICAQQADPIPR